MSKVCFLFSDFETFRFLTILGVLTHITLYYKVVVYKAPLQGLYYTVEDAVD
ncbi:hypothetical protein OBV_10730 [Oscillibacter valericigenes Sjm18-20]|nr:hypothetical protein OBV_10730 [Oscillibacter valericigenes Sjm18-20]